MIQLFMFFTKNDIEKMIEEQCDNNIVQTIDKYDEKIGIIKCLDFKKQYNIFPCGFELLDIDEDNYTVYNNERFFFNGKILSKKDILNNMEWKAMFRDFPYIDKYIYVNDDFCIPYDEEKDKIININI